MDAILALEEFKFAVFFVFAFLVLNILAQAVFAVNGRGILPYAMLAPSAAIMFWAIFFRVPFGFIRAYGAFCAGLFACLAYNANDPHRAALLFCCWMALSIFTIRMKRALGAVIFAFSITLLILLALQ